MKLKMAAPCLLGIEGILAQELQRLGAEEVRAENGKVYFSGDSSILARANICLRTAERVQILLGTFHAESFEQLFQGVKSLPLEDFIGRRDAFPVKGWSINSKLASIPDCQSIVKKAAVERLKSKYNISRFEESGPVHQIQFSIMKNEVGIMLDTSGVGLHKRGYRPSANEAPIKETLAAAMCSLARVRDRTQLYDPFCGSGTILIEGAMMAMNIAPGVRRSFAAERWDIIPREVWRDERSRAIEAATPNCEFQAYGFDIDEKSVDLSFENAKKAGVAKKIRLRKRDISDFKFETERGVVVTNPPYGERLLEVSAAEELYRTMGKVFEFARGRSYFVISPHDNFENIFGRTADKRRKLYNGMIKCQLYMYFKNNN